MRTAIRSGTLPLDHGHTMYYEATGAATGEAPLSRLKALQDTVLGQADDAAVLRAAPALARFEWTASCLQPDRAAIDAELTPDDTRAYQRVCCHHLRHGCFIDPAELTAGVQRIAGRLAPVQGGAP